MIDAEQLFMKYGNHAGKLPYWFYRKLSDEDKSRCDLPDDGVLSLPDDLAEQYKNFLTAPLTGTLKNDS